MSVYEITNFTIEKGTDFSETFVIIAEDGSVLELDSSYSGAAKLCKSYTSQKYPFIVNLYQDTNEVNISMGSTMTSQLPSGRCYFDVILTYGFAEKTSKKFVKGTIIVGDTASL
jgi:hypothetical protein